MKILIFGKNGQLGFELSKTVNALGDTLSLGRGDCDLSDESSIRKSIINYAPNIIINASAYTKVDIAEDEAKLAEAVNAKAPLIMVEEANKINALFIHYSTDYVFNGEVNGSYKENDKTDPLNVYGKTKLAGEQNIINNAKKYLIFRTSWVVGEHGNNFAKTILRLAKERESINIVNDQFGAPTTTKLLASSTAKIINSYITQPKNFPFGLYHLSSSGRTNWFEYANFVVSFAKEHNCKLLLKLENINAILSKDYYQKAKRPKNSNLDNSLIDKTFNLNLPNWRDSLIKILPTIIKGEL